MFQEILRIKPVLDNAATAKMEATLSKRFTKAAKTFSGALKAVVSGTALGIGVNILAKILNPIQELEEKLNNLLGRGKDIAETASRFGTDPGKILRLQAVGQRLGVSPEELNKLMESYADAVEKGRDEIHLPSKEQSESTRLLSKDFLGEKDLAESFFKFIQTLRNIDPENRGKIEKEVLGETLYGSKKEFAAANFKEQFAAIPSLEKLSNAAKTTIAGERLMREGRAGQELNSFLANSKALGSGVNPVLELERRRNAKDNKEFSQIGEKFTSARGTEEVINALKVPLDNLVLAIGKLTVFTESMAKSRWFRNIVGGK